MSLYIASVMSFFKPLIKYGMKETRIEGLPILLEILERARHDRKPGLDDPMVWGIMPFSTYFDTSKVRWTLGAADILFTNRYIAPLFQNGQVIKTVRGDGIYQPALDLAIEKLDNSQWVHVFPEGKVNQPNIDRSAFSDELLRFKWGISRLVMPEGRPSPYNMIPRLNQSLSIKLSPPINDLRSYSDQNTKRHDHDDLQRRENCNNHLKISEFRKRYQALQLRSEKPQDSINDHQDYSSLKDLDEAKQIRIELASFLHSQLLAVRPT
ncbi:uncharacterized protein PGTG_06957 [Puccinia graminis f. sp. tritici CRL 75-36-700-3]|uniref:Tafazzin family protein n=1 Tax=Puccinia graminis f. sp. tritici (strain CRL 75-36-700-3 / race SCCL) TaxID=418459 RepID=E3KAS7_PUCGT|nr:uncharacterized protein PGTG_06957 [Puccinia graminis f. sp. tritici CRL 75-36-700-3]EFP81336.1 hypothetical protein PGTG_06957 [Puccinia graminis f. sp. tritici CRL 75-36-700-3]